MLGKSSVWQPAKRANADDCEKNSQESRFHHFQNKGATLVSGYRRFTMRDTVTLVRYMRPRLIALGEIGLFILNQ